MQKHFRFDHDCVIWLLKSSRDRVKVSPAGGSRSVLIAEFYPDYYHPASVFLTSILPPMFQGELNSSTSP